MRQLSSNFISASNSVSTGEVFLSLLDVTIYENDGGTTIYRLVNNFETITRGGQVYQPAAFTLQLGGDFKDKTPTTSLQFDAGNRDIIRKLREVDRRPTAEIRVILASDPDTTEVGPISFEMESYEISGDTVNANLVMEPILNEPIPYSKYTPANSPGLWGNIAVQNISATANELPDDTGTLPTEGPDPSEPDSEVYTREGYLSPDSWSATSTFDSMRRAWKDAEIYYMYQGYEGSLSGPVFFELRMTGHRAREYFSSILGSNGSRLYTRDAVHTTNYSSNGFGASTWWVWDNGKIIEGFDGQDMQADATQTFRIFE